MGIKRVPLGRTELLLGPTKNAKKCSFLWEWTQRAWNFLLSETMQKRVILLYFWLSVLATKHERKPFNLYTLLILGWTLVHLALLIRQDNHFCFFAKQIGNNRGTKQNRHSRFSTFSLWIPYKRLGPTFVASSGLAGGWLYGCPADLLPVWWVGCWDVARLSARTNVFHFRW